MTQKRLFVVKILPVKSYAHQWALLRGLVGIMVFAIFSIVIIVIHPAVTEKQGAPLSESPVEKGGYIPLGIVRPAGPPINTPGVLWGDQEWITRLRDEKRLAVEYFNPVDVVSYKYHCRCEGLPGATKVAVFHGKPNPSEVSDKWVMDARDANKC